MPFEDRQNLAQEIAEHIAEKIIRTEIASGERILEARIAEQFHVSRSPVREAMRILERYRLVELSPRRGASVTEMSEKYVGWLFEIMSDLLGLAVRLCAQNRTPGELDRLVQHERSVAELAAGGDSAGYLRALYEASRTVFKATGNPLLEQMMADWVPSLRRAYFVSLSHSSYTLLESAATMRKLIQHIVKGSPDAAARTMQSHVAAEKKRVLHILRRPGVLDPARTGDGAASAPQPG